MKAQQFFDDCIESHTKYLKQLKDVNGLVCVLLTYKKGVGVHVFHINIDNENPLNAVKPIIYKTDPEFYIVFSEGYSVTSTHLEKPLEELRHGDIKKMKHRKEVLNVYGQSKNGKTKLQKVFEIKRNKHEQVTDLIEWKHLSGGSVGDRLP